MAVTLDDLISPESEEQALSYHLTELSNVGFPVTAWQTGSVAYTLIRVFSKLISEILLFITGIAKGGLLDLATGGWLTLLASSIYLVTRYQPTFAQGSVRLSIAGGSGAQTLQPGQIWIKTPAGKRYNAINPTSVTIGSGSSAVVPFKAESTGTSYNVALGTGLTLVTPLPGMTATFEDVGGSTWLTVQGADEEQDAPLRTRCRSKWALLGIQKTRDAYIYLAMNVPGLGTQPNRVYIDDQNPRGPGTLDIWLAGPAGPLPGADVTLVNTYIQARKSPASDVEVSAAVSLPVTIVDTLSYVTGYASAVTQATTNLTVYLQNLPLGAAIDRPSVIEQIMAPDGVTTLDEGLLTLNGGSGALQLAPNEVATVTAITLTGTPVS